MSSDNSSNSPGAGGPLHPHHRSPITQAAISNLFQQAPSVGSNGSSSVAGGSVNYRQPRRHSVTTIGISGTSPTNTSAFMRRGSMSTKSDSTDGSTIEEDMPGGGGRIALNTPFVRRMSFGQSPMRGYRPGCSPGYDQQGFNWSEQLRSRAKNSISGARPSFSLANSPPRGFRSHDRVGSVSNMPMPQAPAQAPAVKPEQEPGKPDAFQERILKGDFYMD